MRRILKIATAVLAVIIVTAVSGCGKYSHSVETGSAQSPFASFRDIPGVTAEEIAAIEKLQQAVSQSNPLIFGTPPSTELFISGDGKFGGYIVRYCDWLTALLGIRITPEVFIFSQMMDKLTSGELDFGIVRDREELREKYFLTDAVGQRMIIMIRIRDSEDINTISITRLPRYVFLQASSTYDMVSDVLARDTYETLFAANYEAAYAMLKNGEADAIIEANIIEGAFEKHDDVYTENFLPLLFNPINMMTAKPELEPVISVVTKALRNGAAPYLIRLYEDGYRDYMKHKMSVQFSEEEREYIASHPVVPFVANYDNYPTCFYNTREEEWQGIFFDILDEVTAITGLSFMLINKNNDDWPVIYEMAKSGQASLIASLTWMREREAYFIWPETAMQPDYFALISKSDYPDMTIREIQNASVGVPRNTIHATTFRHWFPNHPKTVEYENMDKALLALQRGEVDLVMSSQRRLMYVTHFLELPGYRTNIVFDQPIQTISGFNKNEEVLCSIMDKALKVIDTKGISDRWTRRTYDYRTKVAEARLPWLIGAAALSLITLALTLTMVYRGRNLRKQKEAEVKIGEADERAQLMLEQAPLVALLWDNDFHLLDCNQEAVRIFGLSSKQEVMDRFFELLPEYQPSGMTSQELFQKAQSLIFKETELARIDLTMNHALTGEAIPFDITLVRIKYKDEYAVLTYGLDLRERNAAIAKMRESDARTQIMFDIAPFASFMFDKDFNMVDCNQETVKMFGIPDKEYFLKRHFELFPKNQPDGSLSSEGSLNNTRLALEKGYYQFEYMHKKMNGDPLPAEITLVRVKYKGEHILAGYMRDLTEQKAAEQLTKMVMEKTSTISAIFDATPDLIFCKDSESRITECNKSMENYFEINKADIIGKNDIEAFGIPADLVAEYIINDKKIFKEKQTVIVEEFIPTSGGKNQLFETIKSPLIQNGEVTGLVVMSRDITQRKEMARQQAEAEAANRAKSSFLATMSHEMRTPMNAIIGMTSIGKNSSDIERKDYALSKIEDAAVHLLSVINDVLDLSKIEANKLELAPVEFGFERMLQRIVNIINFRMDEKHQKFTVNMDRNIPRFVVGDDHRLSQVILNLLSNAAKFSPENGEIGLEISLLGENDGICELRIAVSDNGIGIPPDQQEKLFRAFQQADSGISREYGGTGLGLSISKHIVELMGGTIWIESESDKGSRFVFTVKIARGTRNVTSMLNPGIKWENMRVMVVDDEPEVCAYFGDLFTQLGLNYRTASDGFEAYRTIEESGSYDIYFVDWRMPGMDGIELTRKIKAHDKERASVVVMISSADWTVIKDTALDAGVSKYLLKPLFSSAIVDCINECLGLHGAAGNEGSETVSGGRFAGKKMLLAEDVEINREIIISLLEDTGISIDCAQNGLEAVEMIVAAPDKYDAILMDVQMPKMDGLAATRLIRSLTVQRLKKLPIIAMTAHVFKSDIEECIEAGMDDHIGKPIDIDDVFKKMYKYLRAGEK
jgi:PAS domain S-box-containing protein